MQIYIVTLISWRPSKLVLCRSNDLHMHVTIESSALTKDAVCGLRIPNKLLYLWYRDRTVGRQLIKALNEAILDKCMAVREDCNRVSERLLHSTAHWQVNITVQKVGRGLRCSKRPMFFISWRESQCLCKMTLLHSLKISSV